MNFKAVKILTYNYTPPAWDCIQDRCTMLFSGDNKNLFKNRVETANLLRKSTQSVPIALYFEAAQMTIDYSDIDTRGRARHLQLVKNSSIVRIRMR